MTVRVYRSTDVGAPALNNSVGTLINVLDACLVTGYGSQVGAGWTKEYSGTNKAAYKQGARVGYNQFYLRVDHASANYASVRGYHSMTSIDEGTSQFPATIQLSGQVSWFTSNSTSPVLWTIVATERAFYFWSSYTTVPPPTGQSTMSFFGDFTSLLGTSDTNNCALIGGASTLISSSSPFDLDLFSSVPPPSRGKYIAATRDGIFSSIQTNLVVDYRYTSAVNNPMSMSSLLTFPNPSDNKIFVQSVELVEAASSLFSIRRGKLDGLLAICNGQSPYVDYYFQPSDQIVKYGELVTFPSLPGKVFETFPTRSASASSSYRSWLVEISDTW